MKNYGGRPKRNYEKVYAGAEVPMEMYDRVRLAAAVERVSRSEIIRRGLEMVLETIDLPQAEPANGRQVGATRLAEGG